ncbi:MAG: hypothetical protein E2O73_03655 [Deltaproteobacteria bacterium]|nr:MAG: hypothetical protein E2O73_03655 [Deltaproteobacteria bacterium]
MPDLNELKEMMSGLTQGPMSLPVLIVIGIGLMYLGRAAAHGLIRALARTLHDALHMVAKSLKSAEERLAARNREVLMEIGRDNTERLIEREFYRVNAVVARDLSGYPAMQRKLADQITQIDEDYREASETPPVPPAWVEAVETIANMPQKGDPTVVGKILDDIHKTMTVAQKMAMADYRKATNERHGLLQRMLPFWRKLEQTLGRVDVTVKGLEAKAGVIDQQMEKYIGILKKSDPAAQALSASQMTNLIASSFVLFIAMLGGFVNFHLIALPMSEMVGAASYVGALKVSDIAALVIVATEIAMGLFLMESLRITRLFPLIAALDDHMRKKMAWAAFGILFTLACVESSLAYMRDLLAADREALTQSLAGVQVANPELRWIPSAGQMVLGFMLPFALTFVAIPLESFIQSARTVTGTLVAAILRGITVVLKITGDLFENVGQMLIHVYDFPIFLPLKLEAMVTRKPVTAGTSKNTQQTTVGP